MRLDGAFNPYLSYTVCKSDGKPVLKHGIMYVGRQETREVKLTEYTRMQYTSYYKVEQTYPFLVVS